MIKNTIIAALVAALLQVKLNIFTVPAWELVVSTAGTAVVVQEMHRLFKGGTIK